MRRCNVILIALFLLVSATKSVAKDETLDVTVTLPGRGAVALHLERRDAFAIGSQVQVMTDNGPVNVSPTSIKLFRGTLPNDPKSIVVMAVSKEGIIGTVRVGDAGYDVRRGPLASSPLLVTSNNMQRASCEVSDANMSQQVMQIMQEKAGAYTQGKADADVQDAETLELQLAVEADYQFYERTESNRDKALAYIAQVVGVTSAIYERDFNVRVVTSNVRLWETSSDPYPEDEPIFALLDVFVAHYENTMSSISRDIAVFMTKRGGAGGIAKTIGGVCDPGISYCAGDLIGDLANMPSPFVWDQILFAHEIGHVCGAVHTQNCFWPGGPLDSCITSEGGLCVNSSQTRAILGTIMSYCHQRRNDGGGVLAEFHPRHKQVVRSFLERASCVGARPAKRNSILRGRLIDAETNQGIPAQNLSIGVYTGPNSEIFKAPPALGSDTLSVTNQNGEFEFRGLSDGLYTVRIPEEWAITPITVSSAETGVPILLTDTIVTRDIQVVRGYPVTLKVESGGDATNVTFVLVSENLSSLMEVIPVPGFAIALGLSYTQSLPTGSYTIVPHAVGRKFTPSRLDFKVTSGMPLLQLALTSSPTAPDTTASIMAVSTVEVDGKVKLSNGDQIVASKTADGSEILQTTTVNGVAVFEQIDIADYYLLSYDLDTASWVPASAATRYVSAEDGYPMTFTKRARRLPLVARPYQLEVRNQPYVSLTDATRIVNPEAVLGNAPVAVYLPFPVRIGPHYSSKMFVYPSGDVVFGDKAVTGGVSPLTGYTSAEMVIAAFSSSYRGDSSALSESGVWWKVSGEAPQRLVSIEWRKLSLTDCDPVTGDCEAVGTLTFQASIEESSGIITMWYGLIEPEVAGLPLNIGLRGADKLDTRVISAPGAINWEAPVTATVSDDYYNIFIMDNAFPQSGLQYRWFNVATNVDEDADANADTRENGISAIVDAASDVLRIESGYSKGESTDAQSTDGTLTIVDALGRVALRMPHLRTPADVRIGALSSGRYTLILQSPLRTQTLPIVIAR